MRTRIKICGITRPEDALAAARLGADAIGLVFYQPSPRAVTPAQAREIVTALPPFVTAVALFLDAGPELVEEVLATVPVGMLQFHGRESPAFCRHFGRPYLKAVPMGSEADTMAYARRYPDAAGFLLDSHEAGQAGGSGHAFDWARVPAGLGAPLILAGGLAAGNVAEAVRAVRPYAVDVSSSVESVPGVKDPGRMAAFIDEVHRVETD